MSTPDRAAGKEDDEEDPFSPEQMRQQFDQAIESIDLEEKKVYLEALRQAPHLVETETNPMQFITYCDGDVWSAAKRLCLYWTERKKVFLERAFLPLDLTGRGAMSDCDILCLNGGFPAMLPKTKAGQTVILIDRRQLTAVATLQTKQRSLFYIAKKAAEDYPRTQTEGVLCMNIHIMPKMLQVDRQYLKRGIHLTVNAFPMKLKTRLVCLVPKSKKYDLVQAMISSYIKTMKYMGITSENILDVHLANEQQNILSELIDAGLEPEGIPECLGGTWSYEDAAVWCRSQASRERELKAQRERENRKKRKLTAAAPTAAPINSDNGTVQRTATIVPRARTQQEQKAANAIHSRRKRERRKREEEALHREHKQITAENALLKKEQQRLTALLGRARVLTEQTQSTNVESADQALTRTSTSSKSETMEKEGDSAAGSKNSRIGKDVLGMNIKAKVSDSRSAFCDDDLSIASGLTNSTTLLDGPMVLEMDGASVNSAHWPIMSEKSDTDVESVSSSCWPVMSSNLDQHSVNSSYFL